MNDQSPPKRVTRARAAAKTSDAGVKIATAASKAKLTQAASTNKRKTRAQDEQEEDELADMPRTIEPEPTRATRGRVKKAPEPAMNEPAPVAPKSTRGRPKKAATEMPAPPAEPTRSLRGRATKIEVTDETPIAEAPKRAVRTRAATITKAPPKKSVKFEEPDKENVLPVAAGAKGKGKAAEASTGLRAKPVRKPAAAARATRGRGKATTDEKEEKEEKSSPLSPKKATQVGATKGHASDDELAIAEKTPMQPLMKSPVKPPGSIFNTAKKLDFSNSMSAHRAVSDVTQDLGTAVMGSPARRPPQSPFKDAIKAAPVKITLGDSVLKSPFKLSLPPPTTTTDAKPNLKASLLHSPARRPQSPMKVSENGSPSRSTSSKTLFASTPKVSTLKMSKFTTPRTINKSVPPPSAMVPASIAKPHAEDIPETDENSELFKSPAQLNLEFSGRLSSIVPRDVDPDAVLPEGLTGAATVPIAELEPVDDTVVHGSAEVLKVEESAEQLVSEEVPALGSTTPSASPSGYSTGTYVPREEDENPFEDTDSEDELASDSSQYAVGPFSGFRSASHDFESYPSTPFTAIAKTPRTAKTIRHSSEKTPSRADKLGFTPLAQQLSDWMAASPAKAEEEKADQATPTNIKKNAGVESIAVTAQHSPAKSTYFDDEMSVREELASEPEPAELEPDILEGNFSAPELDDEDLDLAYEADEMSLLEPEQIEALEAAAEEQEEIEAALSEASQEYGNENDTPIDPALLSLPPPAPTFFATPKRVLSERVCHTVSKVPLKPAADDTPIRPSPKKRSASISRLPVQRPSGDLKRNNTVISYSPSKATATPRARPQKKADDFEMQDACTTPTKEDTAMWSTLGTPPRTPRRDVNTALLKGAVVFVDVHTTEGADASVLFNELLSQMGARCVKSWNWNGSAEDGSKVGITHVVFKDGGRRTLERVRETGGVVACVGVGWVLDCERENKWVDEAPYAVDTSLVPRGGHRRRKSMEPRALANLNGTLVPSATSSRASNMSPTKEFLNLETPYIAKSKRRESIQWVQSPASGENDELADETLMLSPIPATPAPEMFSSYGEDGLYGDETPAGQTPYFLHNQNLVQKTAPPAKGKQFSIGGVEENENHSGVSSAFLSEKKDPSVMMRLMAARRKSLQWAPKVGSPLARGNEW
ncbi:hypothetical protein HYALB_00002001 [Hymenoscyphus albidus]|uniref:BRCT domain-containing protein n=1 Tax=Hymenoscyphus albidus TaxID=595503 RepID=A0A9N9LA26_9HELO|nr:hypothetical protein HYALB_00002001 [Hymenoscyphus albidus]